MKIDNPHLMVKHVKGKDPIRVIPYSRADRSPHRHVFQEPHRAVLVTTEEAPTEKIRAFEERGVRVIVAGKERVAQS